MWRSRMARQPPEPVVACAPWLDAEIHIVRPRLVACLGSVAAKAILGQSFPVTTQRGRFISVREYEVLATVHPSAVLRAPDRAAACSAFLAHLNTARSMFPTNAPTACT
ncbi:uracil-DNA glycosylase family protein [Nocardia sp. CA-151230]|uniref:uracil-DNA glycosylase family protein n=1 Tax=Nocardia sp. CA-151230 TaxID=3239982 RepID=UPI003D92F864